MFLQWQNWSWKFWVKLNKNRKKSYNDIGIYNIGYITIKKIGDYKNIYSVNPLCLRITRGNGYIEKINENKYLIFESIDENKELPKKIQWCF